MTAKGKQLDAIDWFEKAHQRVASDDSPRNEIQQSLEMLRKTETDFLTLLPPDILCLVYSYLSIEARLQCAGVARA